MFEPVDIELLRNRGAVDNEDLGKRNEQCSPVPHISSGEQSSYLNRPVEMAEAGSVDASVNVGCLHEGAADTQGIGKVNEQQLLVDGTDCDEHLANGFLKDDVSMQSGAEKCARTLENGCCDDAECAVDTEAVVQSENVSDFWRNSMHKKFETFECKLVALNVSKQARSNLINKMLGIIFCQSQLTAGNVLETYEQKSVVSSESCGMPFSEQLTSKLDFVCWLVGFLTAHQHK